MEGKRKGDTHRRLSLTMGPTTNDGWYHDVVRGDARTRVIRMVDHVYGLRRERP